MRKPKRPRRARNKIESAAHGALIETDPFLEPALEVQRTTAIRIARPTLFTAELEEVIEIIATERVYRAMLARLGRRLLGPPPTGDGFADA